MGKLSDLGVIVLEELINPDGSRGWDLDLRAHRLLELNWCF